MNIGLIGVGAYGIAMAMQANKKNEDIIMWTEDKDKFKNYQKDGCIKGILGDVECPKNIRMTTSYEEVCHDRDISL